MERDVEFVLVEGICLSAVSDSFPETVSYAVL